MNKQKIELDPGKIVLVLGGRGFIGRQIVEHLETLGTEVIVGTRAKCELRSPGSQQVVLHEMRSTDHWLPLLQNIDVVVNAVGILRQRWGETYEQVHHHSVRVLADACAETDTRLVHISVLGLDNPVSSRFLNSKRRGEHAIKRTKADWYIVRPSLVDGEGGYGAKWFRRVAQWPIHFAPANATGKFAPIDVGELGEAVAKIALASTEPVADKDRMYELGCQQKLELMEYLDRLAQKPPRARLTVPAWIARLCSHICDALHFTPFSFGHYELLKFDNLPRVNKLPHLLGRPPLEIVGIRKNVNPTHPAEIVDPA